MSTNTDLAMPPLLDTLSEVVFQTDPEGRWTYLNQSWTRLFGFEVGDTLGTNFLEYVHPDEQERTVALFMAVVAGGADTCHHRGRYRCADGGFRTVQLRATLLRDESGEMLGNVGTIVDVTDDTRAAEVVGEDAALLELVSRGANPDELPVGVAVYDQELRLRRGSSLVDRMTGVPRTVGEPLAPLYPLLRPAGGRGRALGGEWGLVQVALRTGRPQLGDLDLVAGPVPLPGALPGSAAATGPGNGPAGSPGSPDAGEPGAGSRTPAQRPPADAAPRPRPGEGAGRALRASVIPFTERDEDLLALVLHDVTDLRRVERQQAALARLGQRALAGPPIGLLLSEAAEVVATTLDAPLCDVVEIPPHPTGPATAVVRYPAAQTLDRVPVGPGSYAARALAGHRALVVDHLAGDRELAGETWLHHRGVHATVGARVGTPEHAFGLLAVHATTPRKFTADEADFVQSAANVLATAIDRHRSEERVRQQALHDPLTGLANRTLLHDRIFEGVRGSERTGVPLALLLMDLDRFKEINDTLGHGVGDMVLREVADRLEHATRTGDTVARLGGDEFAVLLPSVPNGAADALAVAAKVRAALSERMNVCGIPLHVDGSVGIALSPTDGCDPGTLVRRADVAMYRAKALNGVAVYSQETDLNHRERLELLGGLRGAIADDQLVLHYQPKVDLETGETVAVEALVRWQHPVHGLVQPGRFVPFAERSHLVRPLTKRVLGLALDQARAWQDEGRPLPVAVNVSARMLHDAELLSTVQAELDRSGVAPDGLQLELTESAMMMNTRNAMHVITRLRDAGIRISVDDFGTGYSSLAYLRDLPVHDLKIDKSFVTDLDRRGRDESIVRSIIELAHNLELRVIAEGIETDEVCSLLSDLGCDEGQGYYLGRPVPASSLA